MRAIQNAVYFSFLVGCWDFEQVPTKENCSSTCLSVTTLLGKLFLETAWYPRKTQVTKNRFYKVSFKGSISLAPSVYIIGKFDQQVILVKMKLSEILRTIQL